MSICIVPGIHQFRYEGIRRSSASPRPPCDGTSSASVWPSPRQTPGPPCPHPSDRTSPDATMKRVGAPSTWISPSDLDKKESDGRHPPQGVAPHAHKGVVGAPELWDASGCVEYVGTHVDIQLIYVASVTFFRYYKHPICLTVSFAQFLQCGGWDLSRVMDDIGWYYSWGHLILWIISRTDRMSLWKSWIYGDRTSLS